MAEYITKVRTESGDMQIDYRALANLPKSDATLTQQGGFADAKAAGDAIKTTNESITQLKTESEDAISQLRSDSETAISQLRTESEEAIQQLKTESEENTGAVTQIIETKADKSEIPTKISELEDDYGFYGHMLHKINPHEVTIDQIGAASATHAHMYSEITSAPIFSWDVDTSTLTIEI